MSRRATLVDVQTKCRLATGMVLATGLLMSGRGLVRSASTVIASVRQRLLCEHLGVSSDEFAQATDEGKSLLQAIEALRGHGKTRGRFTSRTVGGEDSPLAENDVMDPDHVPRSLTRSVRRFITGLSQ